MKALYTKEGLILEAKQKGAVYCRYKIIENQFGNETDACNIFSTHFFNNDDDEIGYFINTFGMYEKQGIILYTQPKQFKTNLGLSNIIIL